MSSFDNKKKLKLAFQHHVKGEKKLSGCAQGHYGPWSFIEMAQDTLESEVEEQIFPQWADNPVVSYHTLDTSWFSTLTAKELAWNGGLMAGRPVA